MEFVEGKVFQFKENINIREWLRLKFGKVLRVGDDSIKFEYCRNGHIYTHIWDKDKIDARMLKIRMDESTYILIRRFYRDTSI